MKAAQVQPAFTTTTTTTTSSTTGAVIGPRRTAKVGRALFNVRVPNGLSIKNLSRSLRLLTTTRIHSAAIASSEQIVKIIYDDTFALRVSEKKYSFIWWWLLFLHVFCGGYVIAFSMLYAFAANPSVNYYTNLVAPYGTESFEAHSALFALVSCLHVYAIIRMIYSRLVQLQHPSIKTSTTAKHQCNRRHSQRSIGQFVWEIVCGGWQMIFGRKGVLGVESRSFDALYITRECIENVAISYQLYNSNFLLARSWISHIFVALGVTNCWTTPLLRTFLMHRPIQLRLACVLVNLFFSCCYCIVIPCILFVPYITSFDVTQYDFGSALEYNDIWFTNMVLENRIIFATSWLDFFSKLIPHIGLYSTIRAIYALILPKASSMVVTPSGRKQLLASSSTIIFHLSNDATKEFQRQMHTRSQKLIHLLFFLWGWCLLGFHIEAQVRFVNQQQVDGNFCQQQVHPWKWPPWKQYQQQQFCQVYRYNCYRDNKDTVTFETFDQLDPDSLIVLIIMHCSALEMPSNLQRFHNLLGMEIYNTTLVDWSLEASLTQDTHPAIHYVMMVRINMTSIPEGLMASPFPEALADFELSISNLTHLPIDLDEKWPNVMTVLYIEYTEINEFPQVITRMQLEDFSLIGNKIHTLPENLNQTSCAFVMLALAGNPIKSLPSDLGDTSELVFVFLEDTLIEEFPIDLLKALEENSEIEQIFANGTPYCEKKKDLQHHPLVTCTEWNEGRYGRYPLTTVLPFRHV